MLTAIGRSGNLWPMISSGRPTGEMMMMIFTYLLVHKCTTLSELNIFGVCNLVVY